MEIERRIELPRNRATAAFRAMFPQSRHPVRRVRVLGGRAEEWVGGGVEIGALPVL